MATSELYLVNQTVWVDLGVFMVVSIILMTLLMGLGFSFRTWIMLKRALNDYRMISNKIKKECNRINRNVGESVGRFLISKQLKEIDKLLGGAKFFISTMSTCIILARCKEIFNIIIINAKEDSLPSLNKLIINLANQVVLQ